MASDNSFTAGILSLLRSSTLCIDCLASKATVPRKRAEEIVHALSLTLNVVYESGQCEGCAARRRLHRIT